MKLKKAVNLPLISTHEGGIADIIEDGVTGFLIPKKDPVQLAKKLELLINNTELRSQMGIDSGKRFKKEFTVEHFENRLTSILKHA